MKEKEKINYRLKTSIDYPDMWEVYIWSAHFCMFIGWWEK